MTRCRVLRGPAAGLIRADRSEALEAGVGADEAADALADEGDGDFLVAAHPLGGDDDSVPESAVADLVAGAPGEFGRGCVFGGVRRRRRTSRCRDRPPATGCGQARPGRAAARGGGAPVRGGHAPRRSRTRWPRRPGRHHARTVRRSRWNPSRGALAGHGSQPRHEPNRGRWGRAGRCRPRAGPRADRPGSGMVRLRRRHSPTRTDAARGRGTGGPWPGSCPRT